RFARKREVQRQSRCGIHLVRDLRGVAIRFSPGRTRRRENNFGLSAWIAFADDPAFHPRAHYRQRLVPELHRKRDEASQLIPAATWQSGWRHVAVRLGKPRGNFDSAMAHAFRRSRLGAEQRSGSEDLLVSALRK